MWWLPWAIGEASLVTGLARTRVDWSNSRKYFWSPVVSFLSTLGVEIGVWGSGIPSDSFFHLPVATAAIAGTSYLVGKLWARKRPEGAASVERQRGTEIRKEPKPQPTQGLGRARDRRITLAGIPLEPMDEVKHFKLIGTTGTGKSTAITEMLEKALARGDRVIITDPNGDYMRRFYDPGRGDLILNPFRQDSARWSLVNEIRNPDIDIADMAKAFIPDKGGSHDDFWTNSARTLFTEVTRHGLAKGIKTDAELYKLMTSASDDELKDILKGAPDGTPVDPLLKEGNERMFGSIRGVATMAFESLQHTMKRQGELLSIRDWIKQVDDPKKKGVLFIPYTGKEISTLGSMISAWMRIGIFETLSQPENPDRRLWFVVDELDALGPIDGMKDAMARLRKLGGRMVIGFQSIAQVSGTYGVAEAKTIVENAGNTLILRSSSGEHGGTAEFASKLIGDAEVIETTYSETLGGRDSKTKSQRFAMRRAVLASEIDQLPDLTGFLRIVSRNHWLNVELSPPSHVPSNRTHAAAAPSVSPAAAPSASPNPSSTAAAPAAAPVVAPTPPAAAAPAATSSASAPPAAPSATTSKPAARRARVPRRQAAAASTRGSQSVKTTAAESVAPAATPSSSTPAAATSAATSKPAASGSKGAATSGQQSGQQSLPLSPAVSSAAAATAAPASTAKSLPPQAAASPKKRPAGSQAPKSADSSAASTVGLSREISPPIVETHETYRSKKVQELEAEIAASRSNNVPTISSADKQGSRTSTPTSTADPKNLVLAQGILVQEQDQILIEEVREQATRAWDDSRTDQHDQPSSGSEQDQGYDASSQ